jgi:hypothetical protein
LIGGIPADSKELPIKLYQNSAQDTNTYQSNPDAKALFIACPPGYKLAYAEDPSLPGTSIVDQFEKKYQCIVTHNYIYTIYLNKATAGTVSIKNIKFERV